METILRFFAALKLKSLFTAARYVFVGIYSLSSIPAFLNRTFSLWTGSVENCINTKYLLPDKTDWRPSFLKLSLLILFPVIRLPLAKRTGNSLSCADMVKLQPNRHRIIINE